MKSIYDSIVTSKDYLFSQSIQNSFQSSSIESFFGVNLYTQSVDFFSNSISAATVSGATVSGATVSGATVSGATVSGATVSGVEEQSATEFVVDPIEEPLHQLYPNIVNNPRQVGKVELTAEEDRLFKDLRCLSDVVNPQFSGETQSRMKITEEEDSSGSIQTSDEHRSSDSIPVATCPEFFTEPFILNTSIEPSVDTRTTIQCSDTIRHLVISGGGEMGFSFYGALRESNKAGFWKIENIETIYGTSVGSIFAVLMCLLPHFNWDIYDDFVLKRPWNQVFNIQFTNFTNSFHNKGIFDKSSMREVFRPVLNALDLPLNITMKQFFDYTHIELHIMATELTQFQLIDFSYKTHPDWELIDTAYCSAGLPIWFSPHCNDGKIYLDGGLISNYPINHCITRGANPDEILGFRRVYATNNTPPTLNTMFDYLFFIMSTMFSKVAEFPKTVKHQIDVYNYFPVVNIYKMYNTFCRYNERSQLLDQGVNSWLAFCKKMYSVDTSIPVTSFNANFPTQPRNSDCETADIPRSSQ